MAFGCILQDLVLLLVYGLIRGGYAVSSNISDVYKDEVLGARCCVDTEENCMFDHHTSHMSKIGEGCIERPRCTIQSGRNNLTLKHCRKQGNDPNQSNYTFINDSKCRTSPYFLSTGDFMTSKNMSSLIFPFLRSSFSSRLSAKLFGILSFEKGNSSEGALFAAVITWSSTSTLSTTRETKSSTISAITKSYSDKMIKQGGGIIFGLVAGVIALIVIVAVAFTLFERSARNSSPSSAILASQISGNHIENVTDLGESVNTQGDETSSLSYESVTGHRYLSEDERNNISTSHSQTNHDGRESSSSYELVTWKPQMSHGKRRDPSSWDKTQMLDNESNSSFELVSGHPHVSNARDRKAMINKDLTNQNERESNSSFEIVTGHSNLLNYNGINPLINCEQTQPKRLANSQRISTDTEDQHLSEDEDDFDSTNFEESFSSSSYEIVTGGRHISGGICRGSASISSEESDTTYYPMSDSDVANYFATNIPLAYKPDYIKGNFGLP